MVDLGYTTSISSRESVVIGLLYLMKSGFCEPCFESYVFGKGLYYYLLCTLFTCVSIFMYIFSYIVLAGLHDWLPRFNILNYCLPHENSLEKYFGYSIKIVCETENEVKSILRSRNKIL